MIDVYYWPTPNGHKITMALEEVGLKYKIIPVNIGENEQFRPEFLKISPNNKIPAIVDHNPPDGGATPISLFESGVILQYLAEKTGQLMPVGLRGRMLVLQWLTWQISTVGPMLGQLGHFLSFAKEKVPYGIKRYGDEGERLFCVLENQLSDKEYVAGNFSIADIAIYPWVSLHQDLNIDISPFRKAQDWMHRIAERPATKRAYEKAKKAGGTSSAA